jgi:hypothetical protein
MIFISTRVRFGQGDADWKDYLDFIGLPWLTEVRSIDSELNDYFQDCGDVSAEVDDDGVHQPITPATLPGFLDCTPTPLSDNEYVLAAINQSGPHHATLPAGFTLLGYDLCDETHTSSLLNCGSWADQLELFTKQQNDVGLLSLESAQEAKKLLPTVWGSDDPQALVDIWALYEFKA